MTRKKKSSFQELNPCRFKTDVNRAMVGTDDCQGNWSVFFKRWVLRQTDSAWLEYLIWKKCSIFCCLDRAPTSTACPSYFFIQGMKCFTYHDIKGNKTVEAETGFTKHSLYKWRSESAWLTGISVSHYVILYVLVLRQLVFYPDYICNVVVMTCRKIFWLLQILQFQWF